MPEVLADDMPAGEFGYFAMEDRIVIIDMTDRTVAAAIPRS